MFLQQGSFHRNVVTFDSGLICSFCPYCTYCRSQNQEIYSEKIGTLIFQFLPFTSFSFYLYPAFYFILFYRYLCLCHYSYIKNNKSELDARLDPRTKRLIVPGFWVYVVFDSSFILLSFGFRGLHYEAGIGLILVKGKGFTGYIATLNYAANLTCFIAETDAVTAY